MISRKDISNLMHKFLDDFIKSQKELMRDNRGGFLIPVTAKVNDVEYSRYRHLPIYWSISPITKEDLPEEFSQKAVKTVDMFRRKTYDLDCECLIYFDILTGDIVSCNFSDEKLDKVNSNIYGDCLEGMHIALIHNHLKSYYSPPSGKNFEMLGLEFEEYELILSEQELWILESKEVIFDEETIDEIREKVDNSFNSCLNGSNVQFKKGYQVIDNVDRDYGIWLFQKLK